MKILLVQETDWLVRNPAQQHHLMDRLSVRGHEIRVIDYEILWPAKKDKTIISHRQVFEGIYKTLNNASVTVIRPGIIKLPLLVYPSLFFTHRAEIQKQTKEFAPDVFLGFSILNSYFAMQAARRRNGPFVYYWLDALDTIVPWEPLRPLAVALEKRTLRQADAVVVINDKLKELVLRMGAPTERTYVQKAGIDFAKFVPTIPGEEMRGRHGLKKEDIILFFMGWLYHFSGLKEVARQLAKLENHNIKFLIVGEGDAYEDLQRIREQCNLSDRLILAGKKPYSEIPSYIAAADICLLPAYPDEPIMQDIVPIKMYEYMAMRKPVIATKLPGVMKEFGQDSGVIYVDKPEDVIAKALEIAQSTNKVEELGQKARRFAEKRSWDAVTDEFENILKEAIRYKQIETKKKNHLS